MADFVLKDAIEFLRQQLALPEDVWQALIEEVDQAARARAFDMSRSMHEGILKAIIKALEEGSTLETFRADFDDLVKRHGWQGDNQDGWRTSLIFRTQIAQAQAAGKWREIQSQKPQYLRYVAIGDNRTRPQHLLWHDTILLADHPWWQTHFPPNGFNCRCSVMALNDRQLKRFDMKVSDEAPPMNWVDKITKQGDDYQTVKVPGGIDPGFAFNIGERGLKLPPKL